MNIRGTDFVYYQTDDIDRAIEFYHDTLGLEMYGHFEEVKWAEFNAGNTTLAINDPRVFDPDASAQIGGSAVAFAVENVEEAIKELEAKGVKVTVPRRGISSLSFCVYHRSRRQYAVAPLPQGRHAQRLTLALSRLIMSGRFVRCDRPSSPRLVTGEPHAVARSS